MLKAIYANLLRSGTCENARRTYGCACAFRKHLIHNIFPQLILHMGLFRAEGRPGDRQQDLLS